MRKNLYVLEILQYFCHDKDLVEFFSKDEMLIGYCPIIYVPREFWYVIVESVAVDLFKLKLTCDFNNGSCNIKTDMDGRLYPCRFVSLMNIAFQANYCMWQILFRFPGETACPELKSFQKYI